MAKRDDAPVINHWMCAGCPWTLSAPLSDRAQSLITITTHEALGEPHVVVMHSGPKWHAVALGRRGGKVKSAAKSTAVRANGRLGGRPKK
jgi:hypothetical protein